MRFKRSLSLLLSVLMMSSLVTIPAQAEEISTNDLASEKVGNGYTLHTGVENRVEFGEYFEVDEDAQTDGETETTEQKQAPEKLPEKSGAAVPEVLRDTYGDFEYTYDKSKDEVTITGYNGSNANVVIPDEINGSEVITIGETAFADNDTIETIQFPSGLKTINGGAFLNCVKLKAADLPDTVKEIDSFAFVGCKNLTSFHYPAKWTTVNYTDVYTDNANYYGTGKIFQDCEKLTSITVPEGIKTIPNNAFDGANYLTNMVCPTKVS